MSMFEAFDFTAAINETPIGVIEPVSDTKIAKEDLKLLCEIGVLAMALDRGEEALPIFELLDFEQPHNAAGAIGISMIEVAQGRERDAFARLRRAILVRQVCVREAKAVLAVFLAGFGRQAEAKALRKEILRGPDCGARRLVSAYGAA